MNSHETRTQDILQIAAGRNQARVFPKIRVADVLNVERSGISDDLYGYSLKAHFDFVVYDEQQLPLFAVEFDGPLHEHDMSTRLRDAKKNALCEKLGLPLARVRHEHISEKARSTDYLTWLTEIFFSFQSLVRAQEEGIIPPDELLDPMSFISHPNLPGRFPLFASAPARIELRALHKSQVISDPIPTTLRGEDDLGITHVLTLIPMADRTIATSESALYLRGFGIAPCEAAEEIAVINLLHKIRTIRDSGQGAILPKAARTIVIDFLQRYKVQSFGMCSCCDLGFGMRFTIENGTKTWRVGTIDDLPEVAILV